MNPPKHDAAPAPHKRGVFREIDSMTGLVVYRVYRCDGQCMAMTWLHPDWADGDTEARLAKGLDLRCPDDPVQCAVTCGVSRPQLKLV